MIIALPTSMRSIVGYEITVDIHTGVVEGRFPKRALRHVLEWYDIHKEELFEDWELCRRQEAPKPIDPLE